MSKTINYEIFLYIAMIFVISVNPLYKNRLGFTLLQERYYELLESVTAGKELKIL